MRLNRGNVCRGLHILRATIFALFLKTSAPRKALRLRQLSSTHFQYAGRVFVKSGEAHVGRDYVVQILQLP
jgi:hypothetical protein